MKSAVVVCALSLAFALPTAVHAEEVDLDQFRISFEKYQDVNIALAEGYITPDNHCASAAGEGLPAELGLWVSTTSIPNF